MIPVFDTRGAEQRQSEHALSIVGNGRLTGILLGVRVSVGVQTAGGGNYRRQEKMWNTLRGRSGVNMTTSTIYN